VHQGFTPEDGTASDVAREKTGYVEGGAATTQKAVAVPPKPSSPAGQLDSNAIGITAADVIAVFGAGTIIAVDKPMSCQHCIGKSVPNWRRGGKIISIIEPNGTPGWACHYCGRRVAG